MADLASALEEYLRRLPETGTLKKPGRAWAKPAPIARSTTWTRRYALLAGGAVGLASVLAGLVFYDRFNLTALPIPALSRPPQAGGRDRGPAATTDREQLPSSTSHSSPGSSSVVPESSHSAGDDVKPHTEAKPPAPLTSLPKQSPPETHALPPSQLTAAPPGPTPSTSLSRSREIPKIKTLTDSIGINLVLIPSGTFRMGSGEGEGEADEHPSHEVKISRPFYLGIHEVTQGQYRAVMGNNPSWFFIDSGIKDATKGSPDDQQPVESVTWFQAVRFCNELSRREGLKPFYAIMGADVRVLDWTGTGYRLPTEAEWEYACRAGSQTRFSFGNDARELARHAWFGEAYEKGTHPVARKMPNPWGLFDMHGNVGEWCWDWYDPSYYNTSPQTDPRGAGKGDHRVYRGGGFNHPAASLISADRASKAPTVRYGGLGFRVARTSGQPSNK